MRRGRLGRFHLIRSQVRDFSDVRTVGGIQIVSWFAGIAAAVLGTLWLELKRYRQERAKERRGRERAEVQARRRDQRIARRRDQRIARQRDQRILTRYAQRLSSASNGLSRALSRRYPFVAFYRVSYDEMLARLKRMPYASSMSFHDVAEEFLSEFLDRAVQDFIQWEPRLVPGETRPGQYGSPMFWAAEEQCCRTPAGTYPSDWGQRRQVVYERDGHQCQRCGVQLDSEGWACHHVVPVAMAGDHSLSNLVAVCADCHALMPQHQGLRATTDYRITKRGTVHRSESRCAPTAEQVWDSLPRLLAEGYRCCKRCDPWSDHHSAKLRWRPSMEHVAKQELATVIARLRQSRGNLEPDSTP